MSQPSSTSRRRIAILPLACCAILLAAVTVNVVRHHPDAPTTKAIISKTTRTPQALSTPGEIALRPLPVSRRSATHEWTADDATSPVVIEKIAHNPEEFIRLVEENDRIIRRQLVYRNEPAFMLVQKAKAAGEPLRRLTLPGLDGKELEIEVINADLDPSGLRGSVSGRLPGLDQSMVTLAFKEGREAFSVMSPEDGTYLQGHPREPGELIVVSYDPAKYHQLPGGEPITTTK